MITCGLCGREMPYLESAVWFSGEKKSTPLCHPDDMDLPDCYIEYQRGERSDSDPSNSTDSR